jgi:hypothetical protein
VTREFSAGPLRRRKTFRCLVDLVTGDTELARLTSGDLTQWHLGRQSVEAIPD